MKNIKQLESLLVKYNKHYEELKAKNSFWIHREAKEKDNNFYRSKLIQIWKMNIDKLWERIVEMEMEIAEELL
jgi:hypothetical protein